LRAFFRRRRSGRVRSRRGRARVDGRADALADARGLAGALAQVVELGAAHLALALDLDRGDERRVGLERALHALARGDLAHDERRVEAAVALGDHHALEGLRAPALALDHVHVDDDRVAGREVGNRLLQPLDFFLLESLDEVHGCAPLSSDCSCSRRNSSSSFLSSSLRGRPSRRSGRRSHVLPSACFSRQRRMLPWWPESSTSGTATSIPSTGQRSGRVYCGQSSSPSAKDSSTAEASSPSAPGSCRTTASMSAMAASSPPERTKSPMDSSSSTRRSSSRSSTPSYLPQRSVSARSFANSITLRWSSLRP